MCGAVVRKNTSEIDEPISKEAVWPARIPYPIWTEFLPYNFSIPSLSQCIGGSCWRVFPGISNSLEPAAAEGEDGGEKEAQRRGDDGCQVKGRSAVLVTVVLHW